MVYSELFEDKIGFSTLRQQLFSYCLSNMGREHVEKIRFYSDYKTLQPLLQQTYEFRNILLSEPQFPQQDYIDCRHELERISVKGSVISLDGLKDLRTLYRTLNDIVRYVENLSNEKYPQIIKLAKEIEIIKEIPQRIFSILDDAGEIRDRASEKLYSIRREIRSKQSASQKHIRKYLTDAKKAGYAEDEAEATVRNGRLVLPVIASHKRSIGGFIHDSSATGQTVFIEPQEVFALNNEIAALQSDEQLEIIAILREFSNFLNPHIPSILKGIRFIGIVDFIMAKARLAVQLRAGLPVVQDKPHFEWREARHPLLEMKDTAVVPLNFSLLPTEHIVIVSGPNAGGKSVMLKTVGLLQYMLQCALLPSIREDSEMGIFKEIFIDIGDQQSLENDLSTYSSHLRNMKSMLEKCNAQTLFLIDELGGGTEPQAGGAIAEALVESLCKSNSHGIITTHYANLKLLAKHLPAVVNGAMLFDKTQLKPTYIFQKGLPGSSFAFEIATAMGLPAEMLRSAKKKTGRSQLNFEEELQQIEVEKENVRKELQGLQITDKLLEETLAKYNALYDELFSQKKKILRDAKDEAREIIVNANAQIERTVREIKEEQAEKEKVKQARKTLSLYSDKLLVEDEKMLAVKDSKTGKNKNIKSPTPTAHTEQLDTLEGIMKGLAKAGYKVGKLRN